MAHLLVYQVNTEDEHSKSGINQTECSALWEKHCDQTEDCEYHQHNKERPITNREIESRLEIWNLINFMKFVNNFEELKTF